MIGGEAANRIYLEVLRGVLQDPNDTPEEQEYRARIRKAVDAIKAQGGIAETPKEWP